MMKRNIFALALLVAACWAGCTEKPVEPDPEAFGYNYYPLEKGNFRIYDVTNIRFMDNVGDTTRFQVRERVDSVFTDQTTAMTNYKVIRSVRPGQGALWADDSVMIVSRVNNSIVEMKNNTRRVKLVFPVKNGKNWSGDAFNSNQVNYGDLKERYTLRNVGEPFSIGGKTYEQSVTVIQGVPTDNVINLDDRKEVYVKDIGLVYRLFNKVTYCNESESGNCPVGEGYKLNGHERIEILNSHGKL